MKKYMIIAAVAAAAFGGNAYAQDAMPDAPPAAAPTWTGFYAGGSVGYSREKVRVEDTNGGVDAGPFRYHGNDIFASGQGGYGYQAGNIMFGVEGDVGYMWAKPKGTIASASSTSHQNLTVDKGLYGDVTGRLGFATRSLLVYGKGGFAFFDGKARQQTTNPGYTPTGTNTFGGWTAGGGAELALNRHWSAKLEYLHFDFGARRAYQTDVGDDSSPIGYRFVNRNDLRAETVKFGVNYRF